MVERKNMMHTQDFLNHQGSCTYFLSHCLYSLRYMLLRGKSGKRVTTSAQSPYLNPVKLNSTAI